MLRLWCGMSTMQIQGVMSTDSETLHSPELLTENTETFQQKLEMLCLDPGICFEVGMPGMAWVHVLLRPDWNVCRQPWGGSGWPALVLLTLPLPTAPQPPLPRPERASLLLAPQLLGLLAPDTDFQNNLATQIEGNFYTPSQVTGLLASPVCFHRCPLMHYMKRIFLGKELFGEKRAKHHIPLSLFLQNVFFVRYLIGLA